MFRLLTRHHLLLLISLLPSLMIVVADSSTGISSSPFRRALQVADHTVAEHMEEGHDHDGDGVADDEEKEHHDMEEEEHDDHDMEEEDHHDEHDHEDDVEFEWAGVFHLEPGKSYVLTLQPPVHIDDPNDGGDHSGHDHFRLLQAEEEEEDDHDHDGDGEQDHTAEEHTEEEDDHDHDGDGEADHAAEDHMEEDDHDHDGDGVADHAAEDHSVLLEEEYHFFLAVVPVAEHGQEGIDQAMAALDMDEIKEVANGETIEPSASQVYELYFPAEGDDTIEEVPAVDANATDIPAVTARAGHVASNGVMTLIISVPASETKEDFVIMLPGKPAEVAGSDKIIAEQETGEKLFPEDVRVLSAEAASTVESAAVTGFPAIAALRAMTALLVGGMVFF